MRKNGMVFLLLVVFSLLLITFTNFTELNKTDIVTKEIETTSSGFVFRSEVGLSKLNSILKESTHRAKEDFCKDYTNKAIIEKIKKKCSKVSDKKVCIRNAKIKKFGTENPTKEFHSCGEYPLGNYVEDSPNLKSLEKIKVAYTDEKGYREYYFGIYLDRAQTAPDKTLNVAGKSRSILFSNKIGNNYRYKIHQSLPRNINEYHLLDSIPLVKSNDLLITVCTDLPGIKITSDKHTIKYTYFYTSGGKLLPSSSSSARAEIHLGSASVKSIELCQLTYLENGPEINLKNIGIYTKLHGLVIEPPSYRISDSGMDGWFMRFADTFFIKGNSKIRKLVGEETQRYHNGSYLADLLISKLPKRIQIDLRQATNEIIKNQMGLGNMMGQAIVQSATHEISIPSGCHNSWQLIGRGPDTKITSHINTYNTNNQCALKTMSAFDLTDLARDLINCLSSHSEQIGSLSDKCPQEVSQLAEQTNLIKINRLQEILTSGGYLSVPVNTTTSLSPQ